jgi:hypothetical protein
LANVFALGCPRKVDDWLDGDYAACIFACILGSSFLSSSALSVRVTAAEGCAQLSKHLQPPSVDLVKQRRVAVVLSRKAKPMGNQGLRQHARALQE